MAGHQRVHAQGADAILAGWRDGYGDTLLHPDETGPYRTGDEAAQELFKALMSGLQVTSETRIGRPMGTFDRPRPNRAEARRSGRSLRHVTLSLTALKDLGLSLAQGDAALRETLTQAFDHSLSRAVGLEDPVFATTADVQGRFRIEVLQQSINQIRDLATQSLGPKLGVAAGFNALDGD